LQRVAPAVAEKLRGNVLVLPKLRSNAKVVGQHPKRHCRDTRRVRRLDALRDRARQPQEKPRAHENGAAEIAPSDSREEELYAQRQEASTTRNTNNSGLVASMK
jgi:hypothetical protein